MIACVRTTLDVDDDVLQIAKEMAVARRQTAGQVISELARKGLARPVASQVRNGVPILPARQANAPRPSMKLVNELRDGQ